MQLCSRRGFLAAMSAFALPLPAVAGDRLLKIVFPFAPGGSGDTIARLFAEQLHTRLGKVAIVENLAGAGGRVGARAVKNAAPDDETLLFASASQFTLQPYFFRSLSYDPERDFVPVSQVMTVDLALAVSGKLPIHSTGELIDWMKANSAQAVYGSPGAGTAPHFICSEFSRITGLNLRHVPYKGTAAALPDVLAGRVPMYMAFLSELLEQRRDDGIRIIATAGSSRSSFLHQTPTLKESGINLDATGWYAFYAPARLSGKFVQHMTKEIIAIGSDPEVRARIHALGCEPTGTTSEELIRIQRADFEHWGPIVQASGFSIEN
jgi:tripartite-type tricarboxylate transporter receptor subunit TctC